MLVSALHNWLRLSVKLEPATLIRARAEEEVEVVRLMEQLTEVAARVAVTEAVLAAAMAEVVTAKTADAEPAAMVTEAGRDRAAWLAESVAIAPPVGAARFRVRVQVLEPLEVRVVGLQVRVLGRRVGASKLSVKLSELPGKAAVRRAVLSAEIVEAEAVKLAERVPALTVTEEGTVNRALFLDRVTEMPPTGAGLLRLTVQVVLAAEVRVAELQPRPVIRVGATRLSEKLAEVPGGEAMMVAVLSTVKGEAVAEKATEEEPAGTVTEAGTDRAVLLVERATTVPPAGAG